MLINIHKGTSNINEKSFTVGAFSFQEIFNSFGQIVFEQLAITLYDKKKYSKCVCVFFQTVFLHISIILLKVQCIKVNISMQ